MLLQGKRIFVIEDSSENRVVHRVSLSKQGAILAFEMSGMGIIAKLNDFLPVDLIILDLMLPRGSNGYKVAEEIQLNPSTANIPIVAVSAVNAVEAIPKCMEQGFRGFIPKPIDQHAFPRQLAKILEGETVWSTGTIPGQY